MYKDIITYQLSEGTTEEHLQKVALQILEDWMKKLPGFISWELHKTKDGKYIDIVCWENKEAAMSAHKEMANIPNAEDWYACYENGSISSENVDSIAVFRV